MFEHGGQRLGFAVGEQVFFKLAKAGQHRLGGDAILGEGHEAAGQAVALAPAVDLHDLEAQLHALPVAVPGEKLEAGKTYKLVEDGAPTGYAFANEVTIEIAKESILSTIGRL